MLKHVKDVKDYFDSMVGIVSAFQNFFWIENQLNIKEVMSKNMFVCILNLWSIIQKCVCMFFSHLQHT